MIIGGYNSVVQQVSAVYNANNKTLADVLTRIASGKKINSPADDLAGYSRYREYQVDINAYERVKQNITGAQAGTQIMFDTGSRIYEIVDEMASLTDQYDAASEADKIAIAAEFTGLYSEVTNLKDTTRYNGNLVVQSGVDIVSVDLDPDGSSTFNASFADTDIIDLTKLDDVTNNADVKGQLDESSGYMYKAKAYNDFLEGVLTRTDTIITSKEAAQSLIMDIDESEEITKQIDISIRQEAAIAMLAQANLQRSYVSRLFNAMD